MKYFVFLLFLAAALPGRADNPSPPRPFCKALLEPLFNRAKELHYFAEVLENPVNESEAILSDTIVDDLLAQLATKGGSWIFLSGNGAENLSPEREKAVRASLQRAKNNNVTAIYDADASTAALIQQSGIPALGISSHFQDINRQILRIQNPYIKRHAINRFSGGPVLTGDTLLGRAIADGRKKMWLVEGQDHKQDFWKTYGEAKIPFTFVGDDKREAAYLKTPIAEMFSAYSLKAINEIKASAQTLVIKIKAYDDARAKFPAGPSAVFFGSKAFVIPHNQFAYQVARILGSQGYSIATGGSTGVMEAANHGAKDAHALSIGIPLTSKEAQDESVMSKVHDLTFPTDNYAERITLLLRHRKIIIVGPGSSGTQREMNTAMVDFASGKNDHRQFVFFGEQNFMQYKFMKSLPPYYSSRVWYLERPEDIQKVLGAP